MKLVQKNTKKEDKFTSVVMLIAVLIAVAMIVCLFVMFISPAKDDPAKEYRQELQTAIDNLHSISANYMIQSIYEAPDGTASYVEVVKEDGSSYTDYPLDIEDSTSYMLADWMTVDTYYIVTSATDTMGNPTTAFSVLPESYRQLCSCRTDMYMSMMINEFTSIEKSESTSYIDIGNGVEEFTTYTCTLPAETVRKLVGVGSEGLYTSIRQDYKDDETIIKYCDFMQEGFDTTMIFSDSTVTVGVAGGMVKYVSLEFGGLGMKAYYTKAIVTNLDFTVRETPDFSVVGNYVESDIRPKAQYAEQFDSYMEMLNSIQR